MPIIKAAAEALRKTRRRTIKNLRAKKNLEALRRKFRQAVSAKKVEDAKKLALTLQKTLDKAAKTHIINKNTAARLKSRAMAVLKK